MSLRRGSGNYARRLETVLGEHSEFDEIGRLTLEGFLTAMAAQAANTVILAFRGPDRQLV
jgi:hypothetical protein